MTDETREHIAWLRRKYDQLDEELNTVDDRLTTGETAKDDTDVRLRHIEAKLTRICEVLGVPDDESDMGRRLGEAASTHNPMLNKRARDNIRLLKAVARQGEGAAVHDG